jgi:hypothetical protein
MSQTPPGSESLNSSNAVILNWGYDSYGNMVDVGVD